MARYVRLISGLAAMWLSVAAVGLEAQERVTAGAPAQHYRPGWTFTPTFGLAGTYDDNISLFGRGSAESQNDDYIATLFPQADLHYVGRHTRLGIGYSGSFLNYQNFTVLNRWDQRARVELRRIESERLKWFAQASAAQLPSTDLIDLGGIPYRHTGAKTAEGWTGLEYRAGTRDILSSSLQYQVVEFDRPAELRSALRGGHVAELLNSYRRKLDERLSVGADYSYRIARVLGDAEQFNIHGAQGAIGYELSPAWSLGGGIGIAYLAGTAATDARMGPSWRVTIDRLRGSSTFHAGYQRSYIPSFGFGGTVQNDEVGLGFHVPLFNSRHFYTEHSAIFRDDRPLTDISKQLPLRSLRTYSILGWEPQGWIRLEAFYARVQQTSFRAGSRLDRNRVGFQIVTSKPVRMQ